MAKRLLTMRHIKEVLRLKHEQAMSVREIARSCALPRSTVSDYLKRSAAAEIGWPLPEGMSEEALWEQLLAKGSEVKPDEGKPLPDWTKVRAELGRKGMTLRLLWEEYRQIHPQGYGYSRFCELYQEWAGTLEPVLRQVHAPGEKLFVDWAGLKVSLHLEDGKEAEASIFVAALGASHKLYVEAFADEKLESWIAGHVHGYRFFGGVSRVLVPDNLKTGVTQPCRYEPQMQRTYQEMAEHYGAVIIPARIIRPKDKAKVETGVQIAERRILMPLRDIKFFSVTALNQAIHPLLERINAEPFQKLEGTRNEWFENQEKACLLPLPAEPYEMAIFSKGTVNIDYHVVVDHHYYSVPYALVHEEVVGRMTRTTVEIFHRDKRVAVHPRSDQRGRFTTQPEHRPEAHKKYLEWTPQRMEDWAAKTGPLCAQMVRAILERCPHPEQGYRSCLGLMRLGKQAGAQRLEAACRRALHFGAYSYTSIKSILEKGLDQQPLEEAPVAESPVHDNLRGSQYYQ